jgi:hypothetical protein
MKMNIKNVKKFWSTISIDEINVENIGGAIYGFTTEIGALRLFREYNKVIRNEKTDVGYSQNRETWYFRLETA